MIQEIQQLIIGLDIGQKTDRTVLSLLEKIQEYGEDAFEGKNKIGKPFYILRYLERFPLDVPNPQQVDRVIRTYNQIKKKYADKTIKKEANPFLVVDLGNVGRAHFDQYIESKLNVYGINYLGDGATTSRSPKRRVYGVSKVDLASALAILLENNRLLIPEDIADRKVIIQELSKFTWKQSAAGNITAENLKDSDHDDIVCSLMGAVWFGEFAFREIKPFQVPNPKGVM